MESDYKTLAIGTIFDYNGKTYQVVQNNSCKICAFANNNCAFLRHIIGYCTKNSRKDNISVIFKEINNNMEIKNNQLTIDIPEGMEIDLENSNLVKGIIKFKKKQLTYNTIFSTLGITTFSCNPVSDECISKLEAIANLMNIANYYNSDWKPNWSKQSEHKYHIIYDNNNNTYIVDYNSSFVLNNIYFKNREDAIAVINNPNFKDILNNIYRN